MGFHFSLESVLRLRSSLEDREELRLKTLWARRAALVQEEELAGQQALGWLRQLARALTTGVLPAAEADLALRRRVALEKHRHRLLGEIHEVEVAIDRQTEVYQRARRSRESVESVRERRWDEYQLAERRSQQTRLDEIFRLRYLRPSRSVRESKSS